MTAMRAFRRVAVAASVFVAAAASPAEEPDAPTPAEDDAARAAAHREFESVLERDALVVPLQAPDRIAIVHKGAGRVRMSPNGCFIDVAR